MAKLIDLSQQERPVPKLVSGGTPSPGRATDAAARGMQELGRQIELGSEEIYRAQKLEEDRVNTLRAEEAYTKLRERQLDLSIGEENGYTKLKGSEAVTRPILTEWSKRFEDAEREIATGLTNDVQRQKFKQRSGVALLQYKEGILHHLAKEGDSYAKEVFDGILGTEQRNAVAHWDSPNDVGTSLERIKNAVDERAERYGWAPEYRKAVLQQEAGKVHAAVVQQAIASGSFRYAQEWYESNRQNIDLATAKQLERAVEDGTQKELQAGYNAEYLANENSGLALEQLRRRVLADGALGEDRRNIMVGRIQNRQYVLERRSEVEENRHLRVIERGLNDMNSNTLAGFEPNADQVAPLLAAAKGTELEAEVGRAIQLAGATRVFRNAPPLRQEQMLTEAETGLRADPTKFDRRVVTAWRTIHDAQRNQVMESPVNFAVRQGIIQAPEPLDLSNPEAASGALIDRFAIARGVAQRYQAPLKPLTTEETKLLTATLQNATVDQKRNYFAALGRASGGDTQGYMAVMAQLAPDDPATAIAGSHAARGRDAEAGLILRGQAILRPSTKSDGKPDGSSLLPMPPELDLRMRFDSYVREAFTGKPEARNAHYQAAKAAYAALSIDAGDRDTKIFNSERWEQAMEAAIGRVDKYNSRRIVLPHGIDLGEFKVGVHERIDDAARSGNLDPTWTASRLRDLPLGNLGDGRYVLRSGNGVVVDKRGRPVVINFNLIPSAPPDEPTEEELAAAQQAATGRTFPRRAP